MDQNPAQNNNQPLPKSLISLEDAKAVFTELGLQNLPEDKKSTMLETMIDTVMDRIFERVEPTLTETDKKMLSDLEMRPNAEEAMVAYMVGVVPNLDAIAMEEIRNYKQELKQQISTIMNTYDEEMAKKADETSVQVVNSMGNGGADNNQNEKPQENIVSNAPWNVQSTQEPVSAPVAPVSQPTLPPNFQNSQPLSENTQTPNTGGFETAPTAPQKSDF